MESKRASNVDEARRLWAAGALLGVVVGTLMLAAALEADSVDEAVPPATEPVAVEPLAVPTPAPDPGPSPPPESDLAELARRETDRLSADAEADRWTLQLMVACDEAALRRTLERAGDRSRMALVEAPDQGRGCFRVLWGTYSSRAAAAAATDVPSGLLPAGERPWPRPIRQVVSP